MICRFLWFLGLVSVLAGCEESAGPDQQPIIDTESVVYSRVAGAIRIDKTAWLNGDTVRTSYEPDSALTDAEPLRILDQLNRPVYRLLYSDSVYGNTTSNLQVREITALDSSAKVRKLRIYFPASTGIPLKLDALVVHHNILFSKREYLEIRFDLSGRHVDRYQLSGVQKTIWGEPVKYGAGVEFYY